MELKKSSVDVGMPVLTRRLDPDYKTAKTTKALAALASIGSKGIQMYEKEHEATMHKQAMNDYVNNTINPDLVEHEGAYAVTVAEADATTHFQKIQNDIKLGKYNKLAPEEFQAEMLNGHEEYKASIADSKYAELESAAYDEFWLKNGVTASAEQASKYRITLKNDQSAQLLNKLKGSMDGINDFQSFLQVAEFDKSPLLGADDIKEIAFQAGAFKASQTGDMTLMNNMNDALNFDVDAQYSKMYKTVQSEAAELRSAVSRKVEMDTRVSVRQDGELGKLEYTDERRNAKGADGKYMYSTEGWANLVAASKRRFLSNVKKSTVKKDILGGAYSTGSSGERTEAIDQILEEAVNTTGSLGNSLTGVANLLKNQNPTVVSKVRELGLNLNSFNYKDYNVGNKENGALFADFSALENYFAALGDENKDSISFNLGEGSDDYIFLKKYVDMSTGTPEETFKQAILANKHRHTSPKSSMPPSFTKEQTADRHERYKEIWKRTWLTDREPIGNDLATMNSFMDTIVMDSMQYQGLDEDSAITYGLSFMKKNWTLAHGRIHPGDTDVLVHLLGGKPEAVLDTVLTNPDFKDVFPNATDDNTNVRYLIGNNQVQITLKDDPRQSATMTFQEYKVLGAYARRADAGSLPNLNADFRQAYTETEAGQAKLLEHKKASMDLYTTYIKDGGTAESGAHNMFVNGKQLELPTEDTWLKLTDQKRAEYTRGFHEINYRGVVGRLRQARNAMSLKSAEIAEDAPKWYKKLQEMNPDIYGTMTESFVAPKRKGSKYKPGKVAGQKDVSARGIYESIWN